MNLISYEVEEWIVSDEIVISVEEEVFKIILCWVNCNRSEWNVEFGKFFCYVCFNFIVCDFLFSDVEINDFVREIKECFNSVIEVLMRFDDVFGCFVFWLEFWFRMFFEICGIVMIGKVVFCIFFYVFEKD